MATLNFPSNPTIGDIYEFEPYRYTWDGEKWKTVGIGYNPAATLLDRFRQGTGAPNGVVTAPVGTIYTRTDGGTGTTLYVKESGTGNTGWVAK